MNTRTFFLHRSLGKLATVGFRHIATVALGVGLLAVYIAEALWRFGHNGVRYDDAALEDY
jgi:hypothetical protein